ncbi:MAG: hypothetical protein NXI16_10985 [Alphaproteobacteria bacterium]|nr:hypothetical protein [Alphaproteobacteria bacterium]
MAPASEIARGISSVVALMRGDDKAVTYIDDAPEAVWRSFTGPLIAYPLFLLLLLTGDMANLEGLSLEGYVLRETALFAIGVFLFPTAMLFGCVLLDREDQWGRYISMYNWSAPIQLGILLLVRVLTAGQILPGAMGGFAMVFALGVTLYILYKIANKALELDMMPTMAVVLFDVAIGIGLNSL